MAYKMGVSRLFQQVLKLEIASHVYFLAYNVGEFVCSLLFIVEFGHDYENCLLRSVSGSSSYKHNAFTIW